MTYEEYLSQISRYPINMVIITLDYCQNTIGISPCQAMDFCGKTGLYCGLSTAYCGGIQIRCYNTYTTCKDKKNFSKGSKDYIFTSNNAPLPFKQNERPYIKTIDYLSTEIKTSLTVSGKVKVTFIDEPDTDVGIDPYLSTRTSVTGSFFKKLIARNPNYAGRRIRVFHGFYGLSISEFQQKFEGIIDTISIKENGTVIIEAADLLKKIANIEIPEKLNIKLSESINDTQTIISVTDASDLDASGYIRIDDEVIYYGSINGNQLESCIRGCFNTSPATHNKNDKVQKCRYYEPKSPYDILIEMLENDAGIDATFINKDAFNALKNLDISMVNFSALLTEPVKLNNLYFEIIDLIDCRSWMAEDLQITIAKNLPNYPCREYYVYTDDENIIANSDSIDLNASSRKSRVSIYWDKIATGKDDEVSSYAKLDIAIDADGESENMYDEVIEKKIFCRWLRTDYMDENLISRYVANLSKRVLRLLKNPQPIYTFAVELKDSQVKTGDFVRITTDKILDVYGAPLSRHVYQIIKREQKGNRIILKALQYPGQKICFIGPNTLPEYSDADEAEKEYGFISNSEYRMNDNSYGYYIY